MLARLSRLPAVWQTAIFGLLTLGPLILLAWFAITRSSEAVEREATARVQSTAAVGADFVHSELIGLAAVVDAYAKRPHLVEALANGNPARYDRERIAFDLRELRKARPGITVSFLTQPSGHLVDVVPATPDAVGDDFSYRDWYRGVMAARGPYVSEAYITAASNREPVVAAATLVRGGSPKRTLGVLVAGYSLDHIKRFAERLARDQGMGLTITDQAGVVVASPSARGNELVSIADDPRVQMALRGESGASMRSGDARADVAAYAPVAAYGWTVTASVPRETAFASVRRLRSAVLWITALLGLLLAAGVVALDLTLRRRAQLEELEDASRSAAEEVRNKLESQNLVLEAQALELEASQSRFTAANDALVGQRAELERALAQLGEEKKRLEASYGFAEQVAEETDVEALSSLALERVAEVVAAEIGFVNVRGEDGAFELAATRGVASDRILPLAAGVGLAGRALQEKRSVTGDHGESGFALDAFGEQTRIRRELHVPLVHAERCLGVLSIGRLADREFSAAERDTVEHLADQAAVALASALALRDVHQLADIQRAVLDATTDAIRMVDLDGRTVVTNTALEQMTELVITLAQSESIWDATAELGQRTTDPDAYLQAMDRLQADPEREAVDFYQLADTGTWIQRYSGPVHNHGGAVFGRIFSLRDVTAEREAQQLKTDLVATVSHELRTPLTGILGFAELLATHEIDAESRQSYVETIHREAQRLRDLVNDFLDVQLIEEGSFRLTLKPVLLEEVVRQQAMLFDTDSLHELELDVEPGITVLVNATASRRCSRTCSRMPSSTRLPVGECASARAARARTFGSRSPTPESAFRRRSSVASSRSSSASIPPTRAGSAGLGSGSRSAGTSSRRTAARSGSRAPRGSDRRSGSSCRGSSRTRSSALRRRGRACSSSRITRGRRSCCMST